MIHVKEGVLTFDPIQFEPQEIEPERISYVDEIFSLEVRSLAAHILLIRK